MEIIVYAVLGYTVVAVILVLLWRVNNRLNQPEGIDGKMTQAWFKMIFLSTRAVLVAMAVGLILNIIVILATIAYSFLVTDETDDTKNEINMLEPTVSSNSLQSLRDFHFR